jgi:two-component system, OmpR family, response regulator
MRILVIEDDRKVASFIQTGLGQEGYAVDVLHDGSDAGDQARTIDYDAVVLDLMLPGRSGFQVLRDIRARKASLPVIILTAKGALDERIAGLDAGADDYMTKPFALAELSARLRALLRRGAQHVWDIHFDSVSNVVEVHINSLRNKIDKGFTPALIHTVRGVGYCLTDNPS